MRSLIIETSVAVKTFHRGSNLLLKVIPSISDSAAEKISECSLEMFKLPSLVPFLPAPCNEYTAPCTHSRLSSCHSRTLLSHSSIFSSHPILAPTL